MTTDQLTVTAGFDFTVAAPVPVRAGTHRLQMAVKHAFDRVAAALLLLIALPLFLVIAAAVRLTSSGPAFYLQTRPGQHGRPFRMWKFRTMVDGAEHRLPELLHRHGRRDEPLFPKLPDDPRVTRVGRLLRKYSLDELPQLINVLRGDMSLVGPRPHQSGEVALYGPQEWGRLRVRPGLTGLWQVSGRSSLPWGATIELDLAYVEQWSLATDVRILLRTPFAVLRGEGAY
jgi:lipopolysaccharide/colanic/teichoic acid biosynthesis glycosyltransferase